MSLLSGPSTAASAGKGTAVAAIPAPGAPGGGDPYFPLYGNGGYDVLHYGLRIRYDPRTDVLKGSARLAVRATQSLSRFNLDLVGLTVRSVTVNRRPATWVRRSNHELVITPARPVRRHQRFAVTIRYDGKPQTFSDPLVGTYGFLTTSDGAIAVGEPEVAAFWYPVNDHPQDKATYRISLSVPRGLQAVSNGLPKPTRTHRGWSTTTWRVRHPMASYLAFMAVGHFDLHRYRTSSGLPVIDAVDPAITGKLRTDINASFARQDEILAAESGWFGPYPFEAAGGVVDQAEFGFALENQTRSVYSPFAWGDASDSFQNDGVVVHETAHQWYGDAVSLKRWRDVWLNEGFATYAEWLWAEHEGQATATEIFEALYGQIPAGDSFWRLRPGDPGADSIFVLEVYVRGAMTLGALRAVVGDDHFFDILRAWALERRDRNGTTAQFVRLSERISGRPLDRLFDEWLFEADKPTGWRPSVSTSTPLTVDPVRREQVADQVTSWRNRLADDLTRSGRR
jgi:aminopeptidase N